MKTTPGEQLTKRTLARGPVHERVTQGNDTDDGNSDEKRR
jgi:hypothetical protein